MKLFGVCILLLMILIKKYYLLHRMMKSTLNYEQLRPPPKANFIIIARLTYCIIDTLLLRFISTSLLRILLKKLHLCVLVCGDSVCLP